MRAEFDYFFTFAIVGDAGAGKSSLLLRFAVDIYTDSYTSTNEYNKVRTIENSGEFIRLVIYDICGKKPGRYWYENARPDGVIVVYDSTDLTSFNNVKQWLERIGNRPIILVGTKCDNESERAVDSSVAKALADSVGIPFVETSAKEGNNIDLAFGTLTQEVLNANCSYRKGSEFKTRVDAFLKEIEQLKEEVRKDCEGSVTFSLDRKRIGYLALDALAKNISAGAQDYRQGTAAQFIKEEIEKIRQNPRYLGVDGGWTGGA